MAGNAALSKAKDAKKDEFYTQYDDIQNELNNYTAHFRGRTVLCNCDDPFESNFCKFFLRNFNYLGLKRLICTSYTSSPVAGSQLSLFDDFDEPVAPGHGYVMDVSEVPMANGRGVSDKDINALLKSEKSGVRRLTGDGDFRSAECVTYLKEADIVVTNPPFSLFREYVAQLVEYEKKFLIIGNKNAITYKEIFPLLKGNKMWTGCRGFAGGMWFYADYEGKTEKMIGGQKAINVPSIWYTNLDHAKRHEKLVLYKHYYGNEADYPKYDNYDAINVDKVADIPCDYFEDMGVPITFLDKHNAEQFEIVKFRKGNDDKDLIYTNNGGGANDTVFQNRHQAQDVTESWECRLRSLTSTTRSSSNLSEQQKAKERDSLADCGTNKAERHSRLSTENADTNGCSSNGRCSGIMGVPITFLDKYNPEQFEILGITLGNTVDYRMTVIYENAVQHNQDGSTQGGGKVNTRAAILVKDRPAGKVYYTADNADGFLLSIYPRILIKRRKTN